MQLINQLTAELKKSFPEISLYTDELLVKAYSIDGSPFEPKAKAVVDIANPEQLQELLKQSRKHKVSITFRAAGTGVSGQTIAEEVTVRFIGPYWTQIEIIDEGRLVKTGCSVVGAEVNAALVPYGRFMTSDPSSIGSAFMGGMAATNAAGLSCTIEKNIFHMMEDLHFTLMDGSTVDTANSMSVTRFRETKEEMLNELIEIRQRILNNESMEEKVRRKFSIRNTCGYSLNAFTDYDDPIEILKHLIIGSEGTLAFIHSITMRTAPIKPLRATAFIGFDSLETAIQGVLELEAKCSLYAVEFLNSVSLQSLKTIPEFPDELRTLGENACALLLETKGTNDAELEANTKSIIEVLDPLRPVLPVRFETDHAICEGLWNLRRALYPILAGTRAPEEFAYSEDYCVPIKQLPEACNAFVNILNKHGFTKSGVHGHALHGNLHFSIPLQLNNEKEVAKVARVIDEVADVVLSLGGALKAEHGTGRAVAPFVLREWGEDLYQVMKDLKSTIDPEGLLNPNVILNDNPNCHLEDLKYAGPVDSLIDTCVDCGFCEYVCPTGAIGLSSRQRIYAVRTIAGMIQNGEKEKAERWLKKFNEVGRDTCATDGLCSKRCPLGIDIAQYMRKLRSQDASSFTHAVAGQVGSKFHLVQNTGHTVLNVAHAVHKLMGHNLAVKSGSIVKAITGMTVPDLCDVELCGGKSIPKTEQTAGDNTVVYYPSCAVRIMGYTEVEKPMMQVTIDVLEKAGMNVLIPSKSNKLCCGKAFETKGLFEEADASSAKLNEVLLEASQNGKYPVLCETSPCLARMKKKLDSRLKLMEPVEFVLCHLKGKLKYKRISRKVALHPTCSMREMGLVEKFKELAEKCVTEVIIPEKIFCCGFSGDKGFTHPKLNASALKTLEAQTRDCTEGYSTSRTCEVGLTLHGKKSYKNILYLIDECTT